ncbi:MAG TPA: hypothetical protein PLE78_03395 [Flavobacteriales bacterium]|nr:hypothetical protein [Flavobacteriales bacterium]
MKNSTNEPLTTIGRGTIDMNAPARSLSEIQQSTSQGHLTETLRLNWSFQWSHFT